MDNPLNLSPVPTEYGFSTTDTEIRKGMAGIARDHPTTAVTRPARRTASAATAAPDRRTGRAQRIEQAAIAAQSGPPDGTIMRQGSHERIKTVDLFIRSATVFDDHHSARFLNLDRE